MNLRQAWAARWAAVRLRLGGAPVPASTRWVVLDVESSGLDAKKSELLAIAALAVHLRDDRPQVALADSFDAVLRRPQVQAQAPGERAHILVHGIGVGAMRAGHDPALVLQRFARWAGDAPRLGFHVAFDRALIERAERKHLGGATPAFWLDLEPLAAVTHPQVKARALDDWLAHFAIPCPHRHRAVADALAEAELLLRLWPRLQHEAGAARPTAAALARLAAARRWT